MTFYNMSGLWNITGLGSGFVTANNMSDGLLGPGILFAFALILFFILQRVTNPGTAIAVPAVMCGVVSIMLWAAQMMAGQYAVFFILFGIGGFFMLPKGQ